MQIQEYALPGSSRLLTCPLPPDADHTLQHQRAWSLLAHALGERRPACYRLPGGKPVLRNRPGVYFSLSHCAGLAACLIAGTVCGVDAEGIRPLRQRVLQRAFSPEEQAQVKHSPCPDETFFRLWTLKESYIKATGRGLSFPLAAVPVALDSCGQPRSTDPSWCFWQLRADSFILSACLGRSDACAL